MTPEISTTDVVFVVVCLAIIWYLVSRCNGKTWVFHERVEAALQTLRDEPDKYHCPCDECNMSSRNEDEP